MYVFINLETNEVFHCEEKVWVEAIEAAKADGWEPDGTLYDSAYVIDEDLDFINDENMRIWTIYSEIRNESDWGGGYTERAGQVVTYEDGYYMVMSLKTAGVDPALCEFVSKGSFRIC